MSAPPRHDRPSGSPEFYAGLPTKPAAAGCVFVDDQGRVLILKATYKDSWDLPGGVVEMDESPYDACRREVKEELGLDRPPTGFLGIDYRHPVPDIRADALRIVFSGGVLPDGEAERIILNPGEHSEWRFVPADQLDAFMIPAAARRIRAMLDGESYLEEGFPVLRGTIGT